MNEPTPPVPGRILAVHAGHSANCSSVGSVVDFLFLSTVASAALLASLTTLVAAARATPAPSPDAEPSDDAR